MYKASLLCQCFSPAVAVSDWLKPHRQFGVEVPRTFGVACILTGILSYTNGKKHWLIFLEALRTQQSINVFTATQSQTFERHLIKQRRQSQVL